MRFLRFSLFSKILFWVFMNLLLVGGILLFIFNLDFRFSPQSPFFRESANRIEAVSRLISMEISSASREERDRVLEKYSAAYNVDFFVFDETGKQIAGIEKPIPEDVLTELKKFQASLPPFEPPSVRRQTNIGNLNRPPMPVRGRPPFFLKSGNPTLYWSGAPIPVFDSDNAPPKIYFLLAASNSISGNGLFFDPKPWLIMIGVIGVVSILFWIPIVRGMTGTVRQITAATEKIAEEDFNVSVSERRSDELGRLGRAINQLAARLKGFVHGQKRFLGDISHELNSPLARLQVALELIEDEANEKTLPYIEKAREEVQLMSKLVGEVLTYSKAGIKASQTKLEKVNLYDLVENAAALENQGKAADIKIAVAEKTEVLANPEMLSRALGNILRNAVRYAGNAGEIRIESVTENDQVKLTIFDNGAGVPEDALEKLFDPFYRVETHRSRESGGTGLGLAIVKTCVESCQGKVFARNREPHGLEIKIILKKA